MGVYTSLLCKHKDMCCTAYFVMLVCLADIIVWLFDTLRFILAVGYSPDSWSLLTLRGLLTGYYSWLLGES